MGSNRALEGRCFVRASGLSARLECCFAPCVSDVMGNRNGNSIRLCVRCIVCVVGERGSIVCSIQQLLCTVDRRTQHARSTLRIGSSEQSTECTVYCTDSAVDTEHAPGVHRSVQPECSPIGAPSVVVNMCNRARHSAPARARAGSGAHAIRERSCSLLLLHCPLCPLPIDRCLPVDR